MDFAILNEMDSTGSRLKIFDRFIECWDGLDDPRIGNAALHDLHEILAMVLCGGQGSVDMGLFAKAKEPVLRGFSSSRMACPATTRSAAFSACSTRSSA